MQVKELKQDGLAHEFEVMIPASEIDSQVERKLQEYGKTMKMPGFRPGKVPMDIMKQRYGRAVMGEVLEKAVNDSSNKAMQDKKLRPALQPKIEVKEFDEGKDLVYTMMVEVLPEFKLGDISKIKIEKPVAEVPAKDIKETLQRVAEQNESSKPVETKRAAKNGDIAVIDFDGKLVDGTSVPGMAGEGHPLKLGSGQFIPGFEEQLVGAKAGDKKDVKVTFPEDYQAAELAGNDAIFAVTVHELREPADAEINDDLAKQLGFDDVSKLEDAVKEQLGQELNELSRMKVKRAILDSLHEMHSFDVPQSMKDMELESITKQVEQSAQQEGKEPDLSKSEKDELIDIAERRVRLGLVLAEIGREQKISVNDQELQRAVITEAQKYPGQEKMVFEYYQKNPQVLESLRAPLFEDKVIDYILEQATVTDKKVTLDELRADDEDDLEAEKKKAKKPAAKKAPAKKPAAKKAPAKKPAAKKK